MPCESSWSGNGTTPATDPDSKLPEWVTVLSNFSNYQTNLMLTEMLDGKTVYLGFHSSPCTNATAGTELSGNGYARISATFEKVNMRKWQNASALVGPTATADWDQYTYVSVWDNATAGNFLAWAQLSSGVTIEANKKISIPANSCFILFEE